jgi:hypothetical protein
MSRSCRLITVMRIYSCSAARPAGATPIYFAVRLGKWLGLIQYIQNNPKSSLLYLLNRDLDPASNDTADVVFRLPS